MTNTTAYVNTQTCIFSIEMVFTLYLHNQVSVNFIVKLTILQRTYHSKSGLKYLKKAIQPYLTKISLCIVIVNSK